MQRTLHKTSLISTKKISEKIFGRDINDIISYIHFLKVLLVILILLLFF